MVERLRHVLEHRVVGGVECVALQGEEKDSAGRWGTAAGIARK